MLCTVDVLVTWCVVSCNEHVGGRPPSLWRTTRNKTQDLSRGIVHACARHRSLYGKLTIGLEDGYLVHLLTSESLSSKVVRLNGLALVPAPDGSPPPFEALWPLPGSRGRSRCRPCRWRSCSPRALERRRRALDGGEPRSALTGISLEAALVAKMFAFRFSL